MTTSLKDTRAIVTGADGLLGRATVEALESAGATVTAIECGSAEIVDTCREAIAAMDGIDLLVTHAPADDDAPPADVHEIDLDSWNESIDHHATAVFVAIQTVGLTMRDAGGGRIVNLTTTRAHRCAEQHGVGELMVHGFTIGFARELGASGVSVNTVEVAATAAFGDARGEDPYPGRALAGAGEPTDAIAVIRMLAESGSWITGQIFTVDGGGWMRPD
jgi:NAD(P)-dependent dehydrogenase (short-subunit alcohol dehydrogenase family)